MVIQKIIILLVSFFVVSQIAQAQELRIEMDKDTISLEENVKVRYSTNKDCMLNALVFDDFLTVSGPYLSKSLSIINGERTEKVVYEILLTAKDEGVFVLPQEVCGIKAKKPKRIVVKKAYISQEAKQEKIKRTRKLKKI